MFAKRILATFVLLAFVSSSCKPVGQEESSELAAAGKTNKVTKLDLIKASCELACAKIENRLVMKLAGGEETPAETEVKTVGQEKLLWSYAEYLMKRKAKKDAKVTETKDAGTKNTPPADTGAKTSTGAGFFTKHFALDKSGLHMSTSNNLREMLKTGGAKIDAKQVATAKTEATKRPSFWDKILYDAGANTLTTAERVAAKKHEAAMLKAKTEAMKKGSALYKLQGGGTKFSFAAALDKFKKTEKIRVSTNVEVKNTAAKLTAEAWIGAKVLNKAVGGPKFLQLVASAGIDAPSLTNVKANADLRLLFFGIDVPGFPRQATATLIERVFPTPAIPSAQIPLYGFPAGGIVIEIQFIPTTGLGIDVDVKSGGMFTMTFIPAISLVLQVTVGAQAAVATIGVEGTTTILALEVPVSVTMGGDIKGGLYYAGVNYTGVKVTALGGTGVSLVAKVDLPSPFNFVLWGVKSAATIAGLKLPGEIGFGDTAIKFAYPIWTPEYKLEISKTTKKAGPRFVKLPAKPTAAQCTKLKQGVDKHLAAVKKEADTKKDATLTAVETGINDMLNQIQKAVMGKCAGGGAAKTTPAPATGTKKK